MDGLSRRELSFPWGGAVGSCSALQRSQSRGPTPAARKRLIRLLERLVPVYAEKEATVQDVQSQAAVALGLGTDIYLTYEEKPLRPHLRLSCYGIGHGAYLSAHGRMLGGGNLTLTIKPRLQKDRWSLYWKESMETKTELLDDINLTLDSLATVSSIHTHLQRLCSWEPTEKLTRLEGFKDPWNVAIYKGRSLHPDLTLQECGITENACITAIRRALVPEGWKIIQEGEDDLSSSDDDF